MFKGKDILIIGARAGGYGASIAQASVRAGARVFGTSLVPDDQREQAFFNELGMVLIDVPLRFDVDRRYRVIEALKTIQERLKDQGVTKLDAVIHTVAGGFARQPSVMKAVGDILKGTHTFFDMATQVKKNVYYVNADSFEDMIKGLAGVTDDSTQYLALTYRGDLPYFISHTKKHLENIAKREARTGKSTIVAALPEAWTQSSQFFTGIEIAVLNNYLKHLKGTTSISEDLAPAFHNMEKSLGEIEGLDELVDGLQSFFKQDWVRISDSSGLEQLAQIVKELFNKLRNDGSFPVLRRSVEVISDFVREASGTLVVRELLAGRKYQAGDVRQVYYQDLTGLSSIQKAAQREPRPPRPVVSRVWAEFDRDEIRKTLSMYGENFLFVDRVIVETGGVADGKMGFGRYTVPTPEENPILRDHFVGMPLFGGHLQMEAVAQFGTFMMLKALKGRRLFPILTGTEFPDLNTMAPPGETLSMTGVIRIRDKRNLVMEAFIENRYARSKGLIRGMILNERVFRKMLASFVSNVRNES
jgi:3-hydroxymyristoyl/3-hydroxydecanoyl-(acyl carrier protein) dehydratase